MAITAADVTSPQGELDRALLFPDESANDFATRINGYIADAATRAPNSDEAQIAWVYYRAFTAVHTRMSATPSSADFKEGGSYSFLVTQITNFKEMAADWKSRFTALTATTTTSGRRPGSNSADISFYP